MEEGKPSIETRQDKAGITFILKGPWLALKLDFFHYDLLINQFQSHQHVLIDCSGITECDTTGAWAIQNLRQRFKERGASSRLINPSSLLQEILSKIGEASSFPDLSREHPHFLTRLLQYLGEFGYEKFNSAKHMLAFLGEVCLHVKELIFSIKLFRYQAFLVHFENSVIGAIPIVGLLSFLIGVVLTYQSAHQLTRFGAEIYTVDLVGISVFREIGVLLTAIIVAGRSGSAFTAQIGSMKLNQELDALNTFGLSSMRVLVIPRIIALMLGLPLLTFYANIMGSLGGMIMSKVLLSIPFQQFIKQLHSALDLWAFWLGLIKAPVFAFIIAYVGCYEGFQVKNSAESVGKMTTKSVVTAIFLVIISDALFSIFFSYIGI